MIYKNDDYIIGFTNSDDTDKEIVEALKNVPIAPQGFGCRLKNDLTWEVFELPKSTEATEADYISALEDLGVKFNG